ncbi:MAG: biopolymer transporter ExbD [Elusimicrobia bacterium]|nr:biopolymer transporter ExbD [Elusimicrobiota bacterium]
MKIHNIKKGAIAEINMIPLIDVALIILIIFMVITPFLVQSQIQVNLPKAKTASSLTDKEQPIKITIDSSGYYVNGRKTNDLKKELILRLGRSNTKTVLIEAEKNISIEKAVTALDQAKQLGAGKIGIAVMPEK